MGTLDTRISNDRPESTWRLNNAGDGQHVMVSAGDEFLVYDAGIDAMKGIESGAPRLF